MKWNHIENIWTTLTEKDLCLNSTTALVHKPTTIKEAMKIPEAKTAVDKEWDKLKSRPGVVPQAKMSEMLFVRFCFLHGSLPLEACELAKHLRKDLGGVVLRRDNVKDDDEYKAVFPEQGASVRQVAAARFLDTISRLPGFAGENNDAVSACTQEHLSEAPRLRRLFEKKECL